MLALSYGIPGPLSQEQKSPVEHNGRRSHGYEVNFLLPAPPQPLYANLSFLIPPTRWTFYERKSLISVTTKKHSKWHFSKQSRLQWNFLFTGPEHALIKLGLDVRNGWRFSGLQSRATGLSFRDFGLQAIYLSSVGRLLNQFRDVDR